MLTDADGYKYLFDGRKLVLRLLEGEEREQGYLSDEYEETLVICRQHNHWFWKKPMAGCTGVNTFILRKAKRFGFKFLLLTGVHTGVISVAKILRAMEKGKLLVRKASTTGFDEQVLVPRDWFKKL